LGTGLHRAYSESVLAPRPEPASAAAAVGPGPRLPPRARSG